LSPALSFAAVLYCCHHTKRREDKRRDGMEWEDEDEAEGVEREKGAF